MSVQLSDAYVLVCDHIKYVDVAKLMGNPRQRTVVKSQVLCCFDCKEEAWAVCEELKDVYRLESKETSNSNEQSDVNLEYYVVDASMKPYDENSCTINRAWIGQADATNKRILGITSQPFTGDAKIDKIGVIWKDQNRCTVGVYADSITGAYNKIIDTICDDRTICENQQHVGWR